MHSEFILAKGKRVFAETTGLNRQKIGALLQQYEEALAGNDRKNVVRMQNLLEEFLEKMEDNH